MKTTVEIPDALFKQVKARAAIEGVKLKDLVSSALSTYLARPKGNAGVRPCPFPIVRGKGGPLMKRMNNRTIAAIEEQDEIERHRRSSRR
jgi:hypothetical protein